MIVEVIYRACAQPFPWQAGTSRRPHYCKDAACVARRTNERAYQYFLRNKWKAIRGGEKWPSRVVAVRQPIATTPERNDVSEGNAEWQALGERRRA